MRSRKSGGWDDSLEALGCAPANPADGRKDMLSEMLEIPDLSEDELIARLKKATHEDALVMAVRRTCQAKEDDELTTLRKMVVSLCLEKKWMQDMYVKDIQNQPLKIFLTDTADTKL